MSGGVLRGEQSVIIAEKAWAERIDEIHDPRVGAPVSVKRVGFELLRERDRQPWVCALEAHDRLLGIADDERALRLPRQGPQERELDRDADAGRYVPIPGANNSARNPLFHQLDLRLDYRLTFPQWKLSFYLDVQNVYNQPNQEGSTNNYDYTQQAPLTGVPIFPSLGIKGQF